MDDEPLYYEDYDKSQNYFDFNSYQDAGILSTLPYDENWLDYETYNPYEPIPKTYEAIPESFDIPFDHWLDNSGVGAFGLPSNIFTVYTRQESFKFNLW